MKCRFFSYFLQIDIEFVVADDSKQATVLRPVINVCACHNQGTCVPIDENYADNSGARFNVLSCVCQFGYTGTFCEADLDACEENFQPCYPGVQCIDLKPPANESGFVCGPCPDGLIGDGVECTGNGWQFPTLPHPPRPLLLARSRCF